jgi:uncharacterized protein YecT (DUF1311 family)
MRQIQLLVCYLIVITTKTIAQNSPIIAKSLTSEQYKIDTTYRECLYSSENQVNQMMNCGGRARDSWDTELEKYYDLLMTILIPGEREKLKTAQRRWEQYKESEYMFAGTTYYNLQGPVWKIVALDREVEVVKHRAMELKTYYELLTEKNQDY